MVMADEVAAAGAALALANMSNTSDSMPSSSTLRDEVRIIARKVAAQNLQVSAHVWGVLTAISEKARKRSKGLHILLRANEHVLGRLVKDSNYQIESPNVSANHCKIYRTAIRADDSNDNSFMVYLKDSSSNGTFVNWEKLKKDSEAVQIHHGDIISLINPPEHENSFAFVFREVQGGNGKRKAASTDLDEEFIKDGKRIKGLGIGGSEGPVSLDDVRRLQRSNEDLRQQLECHFLRIEKLQDEARAASIQHENELKKCEETISASFLEQITKLQNELKQRVEEFNDSSSICTQQQCSIEDLNRQLMAAKQSQTDAEELIQSQKATIDELKNQLEDERNQRRDERRKAEMDMKAAMERIHLEHTEEMKRLSEAASQQHKEQLNVINKLEESDKENRLLIETLRSKLNDVRENCTKVEKKAAELEVQLNEEKKASAAAGKKLVEKDNAMHHMREQLENEKAAREDAWAKVATLELQMAAAIRDLKLEKQRLQGARERILLRETQLRAFHSTAEEIAALQKKQQEQLNGMLKTLEDGDDNELPCSDDEIHTNTENLYGAITKAKEKMMADNTTSDKGKGSWKTRADGDAECSKRKIAKDDDSDSSSVKIYVAAKSRSGDGMQDWQNGDTQEEADSKEAAESLEKPLSPDTEPMCTLPNNDDNIGTEKVFGTEAEATQLYESGNGSRKIDQFRNNDMEVDEALGETVQLDDEDEVHLDLEGKSESGKAMEEENLSATGRHDQPHSMEVLDHSSQTKLRTNNYLENKEGHSLATADLLASETAGSWMANTIRSVHCDNESLRSDARELGIGRVSDEGIRQSFDASQVGADDVGKSVPEAKPSSSFKLHHDDNEIAAAGSQSSPVSRFHSKRSLEYQALENVINIVAPDFGKNDPNNREKEGTQQQEDDGDATDDASGDCAATDDDDDDTQE